MSTVKTGDTVRFHYTGTLQNGETFDSSAGRDPLEVTVGAGQIIPGLEAALPGMAVGDRKIVEVPCSDAYGEARPEAVQQVPLEAVPDDVPTTPGTRLQVQTPDGRQMPVTVAETTDSHIVLDANHPLAGEDLTFDIELVSCEPA